MEVLGASRRSLKKPPTGLARVPQRLFIQRAGLSLDEARTLVADTTLHGNIPEPLRLAHLIAAGSRPARAAGALEVAPSALTGDLAHIVRFCAIGTITVEQTLVFAHSWVARRL